MGILSDFIQKKKMQWQLNAKIEARRTIEESYVILEVERYDGKTNYEVGEWQGDYRTNRQGYSSKIFSPISEHSTLEAAQEEFKKIIDNEVVSRRILSPSEISDRESEKSEGQTLL